MIYQWTKIIMLIRSKMTGLDMPIAIVILQPYQASVYFHMIFGTCLRCPLYKAVRNVSSEFWIMAHSKFLWCATKVRQWSIDDLWRKIHRRMTSLEAKIDGQSGQSILKSDSCWTTRGKLESTLYNCVSSKDTKKIEKTQNCKKIKSKPKDEMKWFDAANLCLEKTWSELRTNQRKHLYTTLFNLPSWYLIYWCLICMMLDLHDAWFTIFCYCGFVNWSK